MVKRFVYLFCLIPLFLFSGEFTASVNRNQLNVGETFTLQLTLKNSSPKSSPSLDKLNNLFQILSKNQSNNTSILNGQVSSSVNWKYALSPKQEGQIVIPSLSIQTNEGILTTQPITITVSKNTSRSPSDQSGINLTSDVSQASPYKNEPFIFTIKMASKLELSNIQVPKFHVPDAVVEQNGEPKVFSKIINGIPMGMVEFSYLIIPLKAGPLKIPSTIIQGLAPSEQRSQRRSLFDDEFDPFGFMHGFERYQPFSVSTEEIELNIQPSIVEMNPWIPAKLLTISENFDESKPFQVGEPITRTLTISAEGLKSNQLPNLHDLQVGNSPIKVYADKPELKDELINGSLKSHRKEQYTFIPQESGTIILPEISIAWWDVTKKEKAFAKIPARTFQVTPIVSSPAKEETSHADAIPVPPANQKDFLLYFLIGGLAFLLLIAVIWMTALQKKIGKLTQPEKTTPKEKYNPFKESSVNIALTQHKETQKNAKVTEKAIALKVSSNKKSKLNDLNPT